MKRCTRFFVIVPPPEGGNDHRLMVAAAGPDTESHAGLALVADERAVSPVLTPPSPPACATVRSCAGYDTHRLREARLGVPGA